MRQYIQNHRQFYWFCSKKFNFTENKNKLSEIAVIYQKIFCESNYFLGTMIPGSTIISTSDVQIKSYYRILVMVCAPISSLWQLLSEGETWKIKLYIPEDWKKVWSQKCRWKWKVKQKRWSKTLVCAEKSCLSEYMRKKMWEWCSFSPRKLVFVYSKAHPQRNITKDHVSKTFSYKPAILWIQPDYVHNFIKSYRPGINARIYIYVYQNSLRNMSIPVS